MLRIPPPRRLAAATAAVLLGSAAYVADAPPAGDIAGPSGSSKPAEPAEIRPERTQEPKLVCEQVEQMGSHFKLRVCATPEAWEARRRRDAAQMERMGDQGAGCGGLANPC